MSELNQPNKDEVYRDKDTGLIMIQRFHPKSLIERWEEEEDPFGPADDPDAGPFGIENDELEDTEK